MTRPPDQINTMPYYVHTTSLDFNSDEAKKHGFHIIAAQPTNAPCSNWGTLFVDAMCGTPYQMYIPDGNNAKIYKRSRSSSSTSSWNIIETGTNGIQIATGTYEGVGASGADYANTLSFNFTPKIIIIAFGYGSDNLNGMNLDNSNANLPTPLILIQGMTYAIGSMGYFDSVSAEGNYYTETPYFVFNRVSWNANTVSWYTAETSNSRSDDGQYNSSYATYYYIAIG